MQLILVECSKPTAVNRLVNLSQMCKLAKQKKKWGKKYKKYPKKNDIINLQLWFFVQLKNWNWRDQTNVIHNFILWWQMRWRTITWTCINVIAWMSYIFLYNVPYVFSSCAKLFYFSLLHPYLYLFCFWYFLFYYFLVLLPTS